VNAYNDAVMPMEVAIRIINHRLEDYPFGTVQRVSLERGVVHDVAASLGLPDYQVAATNVVAGVATSIVVSLEIKAPPPTSFNMLSPRALANALRQMVLDHNSLLYQGTFTKDVDASYFGMESKLKSARERRLERIKALESRLGKH